MTGDVDEEVGGDNDEEENALDVLAAWWDRHCEDGRGFNCERSAITSAGTSWEVGGFRIHGKSSGSCRDRNRSPEAQRS